MMNRTLRNLLGMLLSTAMLLGCAATQLHRDGLAEVERGNYEAGVSKLGQDMIEEFFRNRIGFSDVSDLSEPIRLQAGQMDHGLEAILPLLREHDLVLTFERKQKSASPPDIPTHPRPAAYI